MEIKLINFEGLISEVSKAANKMYALRYEMSNGGNLSARIPKTNYMIVKGTDVSFEEVGESTLVISDFEGNIIDGSVKPSKESLLHGALYEALPDIGAIMHCHSPYATAWADSNDELHFSTHHAQMKLGYCPVLDTKSYVVPAEYFSMIIDQFRTHKEMKSFILRGHGQLTVAKTMREATYLAELVEETAQISILSHLIRIDKNPEFP